MRLCLLLYLPLLIGWLYIPLLILHELKLRFVLSTKPYFEVYSLSYRIRIRLYLYEADLVNKERAY